MQRRILLALTLVLAATTWLHAAGPSPAPYGDAPVTVFLVRHAEAEPRTQQQNDPGLTDRGRERARALTRLLSKSGATRFFSSQYERTQATITGLAEACGGEVEIVEAGSTEEQMAALRAMEPGAVAVVAGHSNTIPQLIQALGGECKDLEDHPQYGRMIPHDEYERLYVLSLSSDPEAAPATVELRYGPE